MPELPEIETLRRSLLPLLGKKITQISFSSLAPIETCTSKQIKKTMVGAFITKLIQRGKYLLMQNERGQSLVIHLGMSGKLLCFPKKNPVQKHTHMKIKLDHSSDLELQYIDARRFGTLSLSNTIEGKDNAFLKKLGPDYTDEKLKAKEFILRSRRHPKLSLKALTLNQSVAAGLGNIYACESLYHAKLSPFRLVNETKDQELSELLKAAKRCLSLGIQHGGASIRDYLNGHGHRGVMQDFLQVYDREGLPSLERKGIVKRQVQNGRSTFYCPDIQK